MKTFNYTFCTLLVLFLAFPAFADSEDPAPEAEAEAPLKLKPGEKATVVKRTVVTIKVADTPNDRPSWRCKNIPDDAILQLSKTTGSSADWDKRAGVFIATYGSNCPSYTALEKELPPWLVQKKYTKVLQGLFDMNRISRVEALVKIAREEEVEAHLISFQRNAESIKKSQKKLEAYHERHKDLERRANAARVLLELKFPEELKTRYEASHVVDHFVKEYLDKKGNVKNENIAALKKFLRELTPQQKLLVKGYLREVLARTEYPKSSLLRSRLDEATADKEKRSPASITPALKRENGRRSAIQVMLFELE